MDVPAPAASRDARPAGSAAATIGRAERFQVVVHVEADALREQSAEGHAVLASGPRVSAETSRRLACDATRVFMVHDAQGEILDVGRRTRTVPPAIRRALDHRDRGCRFPGCGLRFCDAHHVVHWADGGATRLDNLLLLCRFHHRAVHEGGYHITRTAAGDVVFIRPDGRPLPDVPPSPGLAADPVERLARTHRRLGIDIDPWTATTDWNGEPLDLDWALITLRDSSQRRFTASAVAG